MVEHSAFRMDQFLALKTKRSLRWGSPCHYSDQTGSTNDDALQAARAGATHGSLFLTEHQTRGRGRRGKTWQSKSGEGLLFSVLLRPAQTVAEAVSLTLAAGLGVRQALAETLPSSLPTPLKIKWPNDVVVGSKKIAGLLCEGQAVGGRLEAVVLGIGVNVAANNFEGDLAASAGSLSTLGATASLSREALLVEILDQVQRRVDLCLDHGLESLHKEFALHDALRGENVRIQGAAAGDLRGTAQGIDAQGRLLLDTANGRVPIGSGTVRFDPES